MSEAAAVTVNRRGVMLGSLASGFAVAAAPLSATTLQTPGTDLTAGFVAIPVGERTMPAYCARPSSAQRCPVVLVVQEIFGVHAHIQDVCRRLAAFGYLAIAPNLFERQGEVANLVDLTAVFAIVAQVPDSQVMADLDATVVWAGGEGNGDIARLGITGFCWGGRITWLYAAHSSLLKAGVAWYGRLGTAPTALQPLVPITLASQLKAPVLGLYGGKDDRIPLPVIEQMKQALLAANSPSRIIVYPDAPHGFHADYRDSYRPEAAADGWLRMRAWFQAHGI